jgi:hypothetical protein
MKISSYNWASHPYNKTQGWIIGPFFGIICRLSAPTRTPSQRREVGLSIKFWRVKISTPEEIRAALHDA